MRRLTVRIPFDATDVFVESHPNVRYRLPNPEITNNNDDNIFDRMLHNIGKKSTEERVYTILEDVDGNESERKYVVVDQPSMMIRTGCLYEYMYDPMRSRSSECIIYSIRCCQRAK